MKQSRQILLKMFNRDSLQKQLGVWHLLDKKIIFTNGVFDILHRGHISLLSEAASFGDILIVAVNSDASVKRLKGNSRPVNDEYSRMLLLASLVMVDAVVIFEEDTPLELIKMVMPHVLVKGGDYTVNQIAGAEEVRENGGEIKIIPLSEGFSTTSIIKRINDT